MFSLPVFSILAAASAALQPVAAEDPDLHCMAAYLFAAGIMQDDKTVSGEEKAQVATLVTYYLGKLNARFPGIQLGDAMQRLTMSEGYGQAVIQQDVTRCNIEVDRWSGELQAMGEANRAAAPTGH